MKKLIILSFFGIFLTSPLLLSQTAKENADFKLAVSLYEDKLFDLSLEQFKQFVDTYPNTQLGIEARYYLGLTQSKLQKYEEARLSFQNFALAFPEHQKAAEAWWNVAEAYISLNNFREAALAFERLKTFHPRSKLAPSALLKAAEYFSLANDLEQARKSLRTLLLDYGTSDVLLQARLKLAEIYLTDNQFELAKSEAKRVIDANTEPGLTARAHYTMAIALEKLKKFDEAKKSLSHITSVQTSPMYYQALFLLGRINRNIGDISEALNSWQTIVNDSARVSSQLRQDAYMEIGEVRFISLDYPRALKAFESASAIKGKRTGDALYYAARSAEADGKLFTAGPYYIRAEQDTSTTIDRRGLLIGGIKGSLFTRNYHEALQYVQRFRAGYPSDPHLPRVLMEGTLIYRDKLNDSRNSFDLLEEIINRFPLDELADDALYERGNTHLKFRNHDFALRAYEDLIRRFPASDFVPRTLALIDSVKIFETKDLNKGLSQTALLLGEIIGGRSTGEHLFSLGKIFFDHLKDYESSSIQFERALKNLSSGSLRSSAWYYYARSLDILSSKNRAKTDPVMVKSAINAYDSLFAHGSGTHFWDDAVVHSVRLKLSLAATTKDINDIRFQYDQAFSGHKKKDVVFYDIASAHYRIKSYAEASSTFRSLIEQFPQSDLYPDALYHRALSFSERGELDSANTYYQLYSKRFSNHLYAAQAINQAALYAIGRNRMSVAQELFNTLEKQFPYSSITSNIDLKKGDAFFLANDYSNARSSYENALAQAEKKFFTVVQLPSQTYFRLATSYEKSGMFDVAKKYYSLYLMRDTSGQARGMVYFALASIARQEGNFDLAAKYLVDAGKLVHSSPELSLKANLEAAELLFNYEDYAGALKRYTDLAQTKNDSLGQYIQARIIVTQYRLDNFQEAEKQAASFLKFAPKGSEFGSEFELEKGRHYFRRNELDLAFKSFETVINKHSKSSVVPDALYWSGRVHEQLNRPQRAIQSYELILQRYPDAAIAPRTQLSLGNVYSGLEQWEAATKQYRPLLENEKKAPDLVPFAMNNLIVAYKQIGLFDAALQLTRQYIDRFPDDPEISAKRIDIGVIYQKLGYHDQSILHLQSMLENADAELEAEVRYYIGEGYFSKGDYQQAILEFLKVPYFITKRTKIDWIAPSLYMSGQSYEKMGKYDQAITMYKQIIERPGIDASLKTAAQKEIDRVNTMVKNQR